MGKPIRDSKGRFSSLKKFLSKSFKVSALLGSIYLAYIVGGYSSPIQFVQAEAKDSFPQRIEALKVKVVEQLKSCESAGHSEDDGIVILDSNNKMSIGQLQFQKATVIYYYKSLYNKNITGKEATEIALNTEKAMALAEDIIFKTDKGLTNWKNCSDKHNLWSQVSAIKSLEK